MRLRRLLTVTILAHLLFAPAQARTIYVDKNAPPGGNGNPDRPYRTIQAGLNAAAAAGDTVLVMPAAYSERIDLLGKAVHLRSHSGPTVTTIDGYGRTAVMCDSAETTATRIEGFTITGVNTLIFYDDAPLRVIGAAPTVVDCEFRDNQCIFGGGISVTNGAATVENCTFEDNDTNIGGGIYSDHSDVVVRGCSFRSNYGDSGGGAGIYTFWGSALIENCLFEDNLGNAGGAIGNVDGALSIRSCTFRGNYGFYGGGVGSFGGSMELANSLFANNLGEGGAAIYCERCDANIVNCTVVGNVADSVGGGLMTYDDSRPSLRGCLLFSNGGGEIVDFDSGSETSVSYSNIPGGWPGVGNIDADPLFVAAGAGDYRLAPDSPCIDAGDNFAIPAGVTLDLAGLPRFHDDVVTLDTGAGAPPVVDLGAYEFDGTSPIDCPGDIDDDGSIELDDLSIVLAHFGYPNPRPEDGDVTGDGAVDLLDVSFMLSHFGQDCP